jgi:hypothetical protein
MNIKLHTARPLKFAESKKTHPHSSQAEQINAALPGPHLALLRIECYLRLLEMPGLRLGDIRALSHLLGHRSLKSTIRYLDVPPDVETDASKPCIPAVQR